MKEELLLYKHNKTGNIYRVFYQGEHTETHEKFIVYQRYPQDGINPSTIWLRPSNMFFEDVEINGEFVPRFEKIN